MRVVVIEGPEPAVSLVEAKRHLRIVDTDGDGNVLPSEDDPYVEALIAAAQGHIDGPTGWLGRAIGVQTLEADLDGFVYDRIDLPYRPIIDIVSVSYQESAGQAITLGPSFYQLRGDQLGSAWGQNWPMSRKARIRYRAGYGRWEGEGDDRKLVTAAPAPIKQAMLLMIGQWFASREGVVTGTIATELPMAVQALLSPYRVWVV